MVSTVTVPAAILAGVDGARMYVLEGNLSTGANGTGFMSNTIKMINAMPISSTLPGGPIEMGVDEYYSWVSPFSLGPGSLPKMTTNPGVNVITYSSQSTVNTSNEYVEIWALTMTGPPMALMDCAGCAPTSTLTRPVPLMMESNLNIKVGTVSKAVTLKKKSFCHCKTGWTELAVTHPCSPLDVRTPFSTRYTPCMNKSGCPFIPPNKPPLGVKRSLPVNPVTDPAVTEGIGPKGFHCAPMDEVEF